MKADKMIYNGILPLAVMLFSMIFIPRQCLYGQDDKAKKSQPDVHIDVRREFDENGNISRYDSSYSYSWSYDGSVDMDSLFESLKNNFGISSFPDNDFFERFHHGYYFSDSLFDHFFNDPFFGHDPLYWPDFDMRSMMEDHRRMLEEMHRFFEYPLPGYPLTPDSIPQNPLQQRYLTPSKSFPGVQEI